NGQAHRHEANGFALHAPDDANVAHDANEPGSCVIVGAHDAHDDATMTHEPEANGVCVIAEADASSGVMTADGASDANDGRNPALSGGRLTYDTIDWRAPDDEHAF